MRDYPKDQANGLTKGSQTLLKYVNLSGGPKPKMGAFEEAAKEKDVPMPPMWENLDGLPQRPHAVVQMWFNSGLIDKDSVSLSISLSVSVCFSMFANLCAREVKVTSPAVAYFSKDCERHSDHSEVLLVPSCWLLTLTAGHWVR